MRRKEDKRFLTTIILIAAFLCGFGLNLLFDGGMMPHEQICGIIASPFVAAGNWIKNGVTEFFTSFSDNERLTNENEELRLKIAELQAEIDKNNALKIENERLNSLAGIRNSDMTLEFVAADVVSVNTDGWRSSFTINKGSANGIEKRDVVVCADGLVGKVSETGLYWATVVTITDPKIAVGAKVVSSGDVGMTEGTVALKSKGLCKLAYLPASSVIVRGDVVRTSGLGGIYPEGIIIGTVRDIVVEGNGLTQYAVIEPAVDFSSLKRVYIAVNYEAEG